MLLCLYGSNESSLHLLQALLAVVHRQKVAEFSSGFEVRSWANSAQNLLSEGSAPAFTSTAESRSAGPEG